VYVVIVFLSLQHRTNVVANNSKASKNKMMVVLILVGAWRQSGLSFASFRAKREPGAVFSRVPWCASQLRAIFDFFFTHRFTIYDLEIGFDDHHDELS
jgi:hypothetical protein